MPKEPVKPLFPGYKNYAGAIAAGVPVSPWDPTIGVTKDWFDPAAADLAKNNPSATVDYTFLHQGTFVPLAVKRTIPAYVAGRLNLIAPHPDFAHYTPPPTNASSSVGAVNPAEFSTQSEADAMLAEVSPLIQGATVVDVKNGFVTYGDDGRKMFEIHGTTPDGFVVEQNVGELYAKKNASGVGAPGSWALFRLNGAIADLHWLSQIPGDTAVKGVPFETPIVPPPPGSHLENGGGLLASDVMTALVVTPDPPSAVVTPPTAGGTLDLTPALTAIADVKQSIMESLEEVKVLLDQALPPKQ